MADVERIDWEHIKRDFMTNTEYPAVRTYLVRKLNWSDDKVLSGNTLEKTAGWGNERTIYQQQASQAAYQEQVQLQKERIHKLQEAKNELILKIFTDLNKWEVLEAKDKKLIWEILKVEMGEPTTIAKSQAPGDDSMVEEGVKELRDAIKRSRAARSENSDDSSDSRTGDSSAETTTA